jgi:DNA-binding MarR family transcriptional regulator
MVTKREAARAASDLRIVLGQLIRRLRAENTFPISHATVLSRLEREGPATTSALAAAERVRPQSMAQTVAELEGEGLLERRDDPEDRRRVLLDLTAKGGDVLAEDRRRREGWLTGAIAALSEEEQALLIRTVPLLRRLSES